MDGAGPIALFFRVILPLLRPAVLTIVIVTSVAIYNDFVNPLYFLPGSGNETAQLTLFNFQSQFNTQWNLLFADVLLITIPPFLVFLLFQRQIVSGLHCRSRQGVNVQVTLSTTVPAQVLAAGHDPIELRWSVASEDAVGRDPRLRSRSNARRRSAGAVDSEPVAVRSSEPQILGRRSQSRERRTYRVRVEAGEGWSDWSEPVFVEAGLLSASDWSAQAITLANDPGAGGAGSVAAAAERVLDRRRRRAGASARDRARASRGHDQRAPGQ